MTQRQATAPEAHDPLLGTVLADRYVVENVIARGGTSVVYRALDRVTGEECALKLLPPGDLWAGKLRHELDGLLRVQSPHVVRVVDFGRLSDGSSYVAMEYSSGRSLSEVIRRSGPLRVSRALHIARQAARAMVVAHEAGVIHRDLKPENIYLTARPRDPDFVWILDFGLAKIPGGASMPAGTVAGTPRYMAPEQAEGREADARTDIYSLGVVLYEMLAGAPPFSSDTPVGWLAQHVCAEPPPLGSLHGLSQRVPPELDAVVLKCLAKSPDDRYPSMCQLLSALDGFDRAYEASRKDDPELEEVQPAPVSGTRLTSAIARLYRRLRPSDRRSAARDSQPGD